MSFSKCKICGEFHWDNKPCAPIYNCTCVKDDYEKPIRAYSFESAAEKMAIKINDSYEYMNEDIEIDVEKDGEVKTFIVTPEPSVFYNVIEKQD